MFGVALMAYRDAELNIIPNRGPPSMVHHDMDAPAWWHFRKKDHIYIDGFAEKGHRALMQFMLVKENGPEAFRDWEKDFQDVYAFLESLEPPKYPFTVDDALANQGRTVFNDSCARCHGTYGRNGEYPGKCVAIDEVGTDGMRLTALRAENRAAYGKSWFAHFGKKDVIDNPGGYVAPPLDGIWASAPYFHNGSVPTLWHILHPQDRPRVWQRTEDGYDQLRVGLEVEQFAKLPSWLRRTAEVRRFFNTNRPGKSSQGHTFPDALTESQKRAVLEYLKTL
jgi:mono/diheme cytochrome c family protein